MNASAVAVRPIRTDEYLRAALDRLYAVFHAPAGTPVGDEREVLSVLVHDYERRHHPVERPGDKPIPPAEALRFHMERLGLRQADLIPYLGASSRVSEILAGKRRLSVPMIRALSQGLGIPAEDLLGEMDDGS
jgi:HTH-type transcriptional regulator / antitoxin HigA